MHGPYSRGHLVLSILRKTRQVVHSKRLLRTLGTAFISEVTSVMLYLISVNILIYVAITDGVLCNFYIQIKVIRYKTNRSTE